MNPLSAVFMFGALITQIFVDTIKLMTGFHRPYFLSLCNVSFPNCTAPLEHSPSPSPFLACNYRNADELRYASLTFPSLHAAFSSFSAIFASVSQRFWDQDCPGPKYPESMDSGQPC